MINQENQRGHLRPDDNEMRNGIITSDHVIGALQQQLFTEFVAGLSGRERAEAESAIRLEALRVFLLPTLRTLDELGLPRKPSVAGRIGSTVFRRQQQQPVQTAEQRQLSDNAHALLYGLRRELAALHQESGDYKKSKYNVTRAIIQKFIYGRTAA